MTSQVLVCLEFLRLWRLGEYKEVAVKIGGQLGMSLFCQSDPGVGLQLHLPSSHISLPK